LRKKTIIIVISVVGAVGVAAFVSKRFHQDYERYFSVEEGDVVLDVGAADGAFTTIAARKAGLVISIEPEPNFVTVLNNKFTGLSNVVIINKAAFNQKRVLPFYPNGYASSLISGSHCCIEVQADTLDNIVRELGIQRVDFVKMDIEGSEVEALLGAESVLRMARKVVVAAYHHNRADINPTYPWVEAFLHGKGFHTKVGWAGFVDGMGLVYAWRGG